MPIETRSLHPWEYDQLGTFLGSAFDSEPWWTAGDEDALNPLLKRSNTPNLLVRVCEGEILSHVGTVTREAVIDGCTLKAGFLSAVATRQDQRRRGHASHLFAEAMARFRAQGVDFVHVSGDRDLYRRFGCERVGFTVRLEISAALAESHASPSLSLRVATPGDVPAMEQLYGAESVRWLREPDDYLYPHIMSWPADPVLVWEGETPCAWMVFAKPTGSGGEKSALLEFAGDRHRVVAALGHYAKKHNLAAVIVYAPDQDDEIDLLMTQCGADRNRHGGFPSIALVCFAQFMERMRPRFAQVVGSELAGALAFHETDDECTITLGSEVLTASRNDMVQRIFGSESFESRSTSGGGALGDLLDRLFPIPLPWPGLNWV